MWDSYFKAWSNTFLALQVVSARLPVLYMMMIDPTPGRGREVGRMISEKQEALLEGLAAAQDLLARAAGDMIVAPGRNLYCNGLAEAYVEALTLPAERILQANARRLSPPASRDR